MVEALYGVDESVKVVGSLLTDKRFADDQGMVAETEQVTRRIIKTAVWSVLVYRSET